METIGNLIDKITILNLRIFHLAEQAQLKAHNEKHIENCQGRLEILNNQRNDLIVELNNLFVDIKTGKRKIKVYRQFKMYNDPNYKLPSKL